MHETHAYIKHCPAGEGKVFALRPSSPCLPIPLSAGAPLQRVNDVSLHATSLVFAIRILLTLLTYSFGPPPCRVQESQTGGKQER